MAPTVTVWNENVHEQEDDAVADIYPDGIHGTIADALADHGFETETATLQDPEHGLTEDVLEETDVLVWWSHIAQDEVEDAVAERVADAVRGGMGLIVLHSAVLSTVFRLAHGDDGDPEMAGGRRTRAPVGDRADPPHRRGRRRMHRTGADRDVRRTVRRSHA